MILRLVCIWLVFLFIVVIADARNHEPEKLMHVLSRFLKDTANCSELPSAIKWVLETVR
jgi:hypothetical protein